MSANISSRQASRAGAYARRGQQELESSLREALERNRFSLVHQPEFDAAVVRALSAEALIRWQLLAAG